MRTFDGYIRVSRVAGRSGPGFISPDVQRETIARLAGYHRLEVGEVVEELDVSGGKSIDDRELGRLVRKVEASESGGLLVWKVSRFSRNLVDGVTAAVRELDAFLAGASVEDLGAETYNAEVRRRRMAVREAGEAYREALATQEELARREGGERAVARQLVESATLRRSKPRSGGRGWDPIEERLEIVWR